MICGTSTTSRVDSVPAWLSSGFCARASRSQMDLLRRTAPSASPAQRKGKMSCAHEAHVSTRTARWRRPARSSRSRSRRWQASGGEPGGEEGVCPAALRAAGSLQASSRPGDPYQLPQHGIMQRCLRWQVSRTRRAGEAVLPRQPIGQRGAGERRSRRHSAVEEVRTRRAAAAKRCGLFSGQQG